MAKHRGDRGYFKNAFEYWGNLTGSFKWGIDLISEQSIGFHRLKNAAYQYRIYALFHPEACPSDSILVQNITKAGVKVNAIVKEGIEGVSGENQDGSDTDTVANKDDDKDNDNKDNEKDDDTDNNDDDEEAEQG